MVAWPNGKAVIAPAWREGILLVDLIIQKPVNGLIYLRDIQ